MRKFNQMLSLAAALTLASLVRTAPAAEPLGSAPVIAIANLDKIRASMAEWKDVLDQLDLEKKTYQNQAVDKDNALKQEKAALAFLTAGSQRYVDEEKKYEHDMIEADVWAKEQQAALERDFKNRLKQTFLEIQDAVQQVAQKDGITLVIADQRPAIPDNLEDTPTNELQARITQRTVLFADQSRDISGEVITLLDRNYAARSAAPPAATPAK